jgi:hypothetical protein
MVPYEGGNYPATDDVTIGSGLTAPVRASVSARGDIYIVDNGANQIVGVNRSQASFTFSPQTVEIPSAPQVGSMWNIGYGATTPPQPPLTFQTPMASNSGDSDSFLFSPGPTIGNTNGCNLSGGGTITFGYGCTVQVTSLPTKIGAVSATTTLLMTNAVNLTPVAVQLAGTGVGWQTVIISFTASPTSILSSGSTLLTATVSGSIPPTGNVDFYVGTTRLGTAMLGMPNGPTATATLTVNGSQLAIGNNQITASYEGDTHDLPSTSPTPITVTVTPPVLIATQTSLTAPSVMVQGTPYNFVATVSAVGTGTGTAPSGSVTFFDMTTSSTMATVALTAVDSAHATATFQAYAGSLVIDMNNVTAIYSGDPWYNGSTSPTVSVDVIYPKTGFPATTVGQQSPPSGIYVASAQPFTLGSYAILTYGDGAPNQEFLDAGGSTQPCTAGQTYNLGDRCMVNVIFAPKRVGSRAGAIVLYDQNNVQVAIRYLGATGNGPMLAFDQGAQNTVSPLSSPHGLSTDMVSMFVADTGSKRVLQLPETTGVYSAANATTVLSGLINPVDVSIDGAGNVYVVDAGSGNNDGSVIMVPKKYDGTLDSANPVVLLSATVNNNLSTVNYGAPKALTVFTGGNMFVAYANQIVQVFSANGVLQFTAPANGTSCPTTGQFFGQCVVDSGYTNLSSITGDPNSNLYVADAGNPSATPPNAGQVVKIPGLANVGCYNSSINSTGCTFDLTRKTILGSGFNQPNGVGIDMAGNIYVADTGNARVVMIPNESGTLNSADQITYGTGLVSPVRVSAFKSGSVYIADAGANQIVWIDRSTASFSFAPQSVGVAGPPQTLTLRDVGNQTVTFNTPATTATGDCASFEWVGGANGCNVTLLANIAPTSSGLGSYSTTFWAQPAKSGTLSATETLSSNANVGLKAITVQLGGTGIALQATTALTANPTNIPPTGSTQLTATVTGASSTIAPTGNVAFYLGPSTTKLGEVALGAATGSTATATLTVSASQIVASAYDTFTASYEGDSNYASSASSQPVTVTVNGGPTPTITWAPPTSIIYGTVLSGTQLNAAATYNGATVAGTFLYNPPAGTALTAGTQTLSVTFTPTSSANYSPATASVTLQVGQATPKITWATPAAIIYGTPLSSTQLNATASVPGTFTYLPAAGTLLTAGANPLSVTFTPNDTVNYGSASAKNTITVNKAVPTITWPISSAISYGTALNSTQLNASATDASGNTIPGQTVYSPAAGTILAGGTQTLSVTFTPTDTTDYTTAKASVMLQVNSITPTLTWNIPAAITYGMALSTAQLNATASYNNGTTQSVVAGTYLYNPPVGTMLTAGTQTLSVTFTPSNSATFGGPISTNVTLQVNQAAPKITWPTPAAITYGTPLSSTQLNATASVPGTLQYSQPLGTVLPAGVQPLSVTFTPNDAVDYTSATANITFTVNKATPTVTFTGAPANAEKGTMFTVSATTNATTTAVITASGYCTLAAGNIVTMTSGTGTCTLTAKWAADNNYLAATATQTTAASTSNVSITWLPTPITYGTQLGAAQLNATAASNGVSVPGSYAYTPPTGTVLTAGTQRLSVTFTPNDTSTFNLATVSVNLTVNKATPTIIWLTPASINYGTALSSTQLNASATDANGNTVAGTFVYSPAAGTVLAGSNQTLSVTFTPNDATDYNTAKASVTLQVNPGTVNIAWSNPAAITYGTPLSGAQLNATARSNGATVAGTYFYNPPAGTLLTAGTQPQQLSVTFTPANSANYGGPITANVLLQVNQATPKVTWPKPAAITYGTALSSTQLNATASVPGTFSYSPAVGTMFQAGTQTLSVTFTPTDSTDYAAVTVSTTITVNKAVPAITWLTPSAISYGTQLGSTQLNATFADVNGNPLSGTPVYSPAAGSILAGGTQTLSVAFNPTDTTDYSTAKASVTLQVNSVTPTIAWTPAAGTYGTPLGAAQLNATVSYNSSAVAGTYLYSPPTGTILTAGAQTLSVTFTPTNRASFGGPISTSVTLQVNPATPKISWPKPAAITYGTPLSSTQLNAAVSTTLPGTTVPLPGTFVYTPAAGTVVPGGTQTLSVTFTPTDATDYAPVTVSTTITVNPATPTITWMPKPLASIIYGSPLSLTQLGATASATVSGTSTAVLGTFAYSATIAGTPMVIGPGTVLPAGTYTISAAFTPADMADYKSPATVTNTLTVSKAPSTISVTPSANPSPHGQPIVFTVTVGGPNGPVLPTGTVTVTATLGGACIGTLVGGVWSPAAGSPPDTGSCSISFGTKGTPSVRASYSGDSNYAASSSASFTETVN